MSKIEWCDKTWNPITGCSPISEGCENCYAKKMTSRLRGRFGYDKDDPFKITLHEDKLDQPSRWKKPRKIFVDSMGDLFHKDVPFKWIYRVIESMAASPHHIYMLLTKRPDRMLEYHRWTISTHKLYTFPLSFCWLGVTTENQKRADERTPILLEIPTAIRFISAEPMLEPLASDFDMYLTGKDMGRPCYPAKLDWVICGGETGPGARPMPPEGPRGLRDQCAATGVPFFFKSWGKWTYYEGPPIRCIYNHGTGHYYTGGKDHLLDGKEHHQFPEGF